MEEIIFDEAFMQQLSRLQMAISLKLHEGMQGGRKSSAKGSSLEFSDFREYEPGDDFRRIDWTAYGRLDKLFVKVFMEEKEALFNLFVDTSKSMGFGSPSKGKTSLQMVAALAYIIMARQDKVNIRLLGEASNAAFTEIKVNQGTGKAGFHQMLTNLSDTSFSSSDNMCDQLLRAPIQGKGVSIIFSDFLFQEGLASLEKALSYLRYKKQHIILVQVLSKEEREPEDVGDFEFIDSETGGKVRLSLNPKMLKAYKMRLQEYRNQLETLARKYNTKVVMISAESDIETIILKDFYEKQIVF